MSNLADVEYLWSSILQQVAVASSDGDSVHLSAQHTRALFEVLRRTHLVFRVGKDGELTDLVVEGKVSDE